MSLAGQHHVHFLVISADAQGNGWIHRPAGWGLCNGQQCVLYCSMGNITNLLTSPCKGTWAADKNSSLHVKGRQSTPGVLDPLALEECRCNGGADMQRLREAASRVSACCYVHYGMPRLPPGVLIY